jgi:hypothetical protein
MALLNPGKVGIGAWMEFTTLNGQPATGDPGNPTTSQVTLDALNAIKFPWYHTWHDNKLTGNQGAINWIPCWNTIAEVNPTSLARFKADGDLVVASSEPWNSFGGTFPTISPAECIAIWPQLMALGNRLSTPSISGPNDGNDWLAQFMAGINANGYRVDVINIHFYSPDGNMDNFKNFLIQTHNLYGRPVIVTEWARYVNWGIQGTTTSPPQLTPAEQAAWAIAGTQMMDTLDFVERHSWYAASTGGGGVLYLGSEAILADGSMSPVGQAFFQMLNPGQALPPPPTTSNTTFVAEFYKNGILVGTANKLPSGTLYPILSLANNTEAATANFGSSPLAFLPAGITSWDGSQIGTGGATDGTGGTGTTSGHTELD